MQQWKECPLAGTLPIPSSVYDISVMGNAGPKLPESSCGFVLSFAPLQWIFFFLFETLRKELP